MNLGDMSGMPSPDDCGGDGNKTNTPPSTGRSHADALAAMFGVSATATGPSSPLRERLVRLPTKTLKELMRLRAVEWYVEGWLQRGLAGTLVAEGGLGKTTLLMELAISTATGRPWLGSPVGRTGTFVLLSRDDSQEDLDAVLAELLHAKQQHDETRLTDKELDAVRLRVLLISLRDLTGITFAAQVQKVGVVATNVADTIIDGLKGQEPVCVAFDTLRQFSGGQSNDEHIMTIATQAATRIADQLKCTVIVTHHTGKAQFRAGVDDQYAASGSSAISDNLRFSLLLQRSSWEDAQQELNIPPEARRQPPAADGPRPEESVLVLKSTRGSLRVLTPKPKFYVRRGWDIEPIFGQRRTAADRDRAAFAELATVIDRLGGQASSDAIRDARGANNSANRNLVNRFIGLGWLARPTERSGVVVTDLGREQLHPPL